MFQYNILDHFKMVRPQFTKQQRAYLVTEYARLNNVAHVLRRFRQQYPNVRCPARNTVYSNVLKYQREGTSCNLNKGRSGRLRTARNVENVVAVRQVLQHQGEHHRVSCRRNGLGMTSATFNRITRLDLRYHPYQMIKRHQLLAGDFARRLRFCQWLNGHAPRFLETLLIGDEAGFAMNGDVNTHNVRRYAARGNKPLDFVYEKSANRAKLTVWIGLIGNGTLVGPCFFRETVNGDRYLHLINNTVVPHLAAIRQYRRNGNGPFQRVWWAQDGAPAHRRRDVMDRLDELFGNRIIAFPRDVEWPPRSPDLTPLDFFLWGHLKAKVYTTQPRDIDDLQRRITAEVDVLRQDHGMIRRAVSAMRKRATICIERNGGHVED